MNHKEKQQSTKIEEYSRKELVKLNELVLYQQKITMVAFNYTAYL
ncbi:MULTISPECIES: hypothetical protein [Bacillus cereus group]|nr:MULTISPECIES: hypothetical protein [Bacillus cereus group]MDA2479786.1 hypothetical protein [Bacillus cereus]MDA2496785.1 hypothetical protein [Bacillus cereus]